ncbi:branched-chain amino acid ABC transporter permease [Dysosmobacter sp.]|uniref:branched-chain amino acid ABC transporter permease n=1 Tax=Dysosmobacter sp. TaxID=2591382 RepID=UPI00201A4E84|nr:branched-chain amino acid ABC transporter permease [Dysosmobacter sp.]MCI6055453.1 branched-chain amino acid ABC transporter permease [Dysosmobacter sp.]MDY5511028.1 branched-chain amino acid ABC transporter permease [Dysosmobacter sp.]
MLQEKKSKRGTLVVLLCTVALLALVILLENTMKSTHMLFTVLKKGAVYAVVASSMNLLNGFTGLFSLGQSGFMLLGAYTYAILTIPVAARESVYYIYQGSAINFSLPELFGGGAVGLVIGVLLALILSGIVAAAVAWLIGLPVLRLKSDYLAIATLGFGEIIRAIFQWDKLGPVTNGANALKSFPTFSSFNIELPGFALRLSTFVPFLLGALCIGGILLLINSTYGRAFKAIRDDEVAAEAMGINLSRHKRLAFCISSFFAGVGGGMFAMFANQAQAKTFTTAMTYEILLIVVIGGIGSISGSCIAAFLYVAASEWWLRFLDTSVTFTSPADPRRIAFIAIYAIVVVGGAVLLILRDRRGEKVLWKEIVTGVVALALMGWLAMYLAGGSMTMPFLRNGFRMVVFSLVIMVVVLFFRRGLMGDKELPDLFRRKRPAKAVKGGGANG